MKRKTTAGITSFSVPIKVFSTASTTGAGLTGLTSATSGLVAEYRRQGQSTWTAISLVGAPTKSIGTWTSGGFLADGSRGAYELDLPNAAMAAGARFVLVRLYGAANMLDVDIEIELDAVDYQTAALGAALASDWTSTRAGYLDGVLLAANYNQRTVSVTGANHVAADIHELQPAVIDSTHFAPGAIDDNALAASAVTEIQSGLATSANQTILIDGVGFITSVLMGSISDAGTAAETYQIAFGGATYTVDYSGLDATGNRSTTTRTKT